MIAPPPPASELLVGQDRRGALLGERGQHGLRAGAGVHDLRLVDALRGLGDLQELGLRTTAEPRLEGPRRSLPAHVPIGEVDGARAAASGPVPAREGAQPGGPLLGLAGEAYLVQILVEVFL